MTQTRQDRAERAELMALADRFDNARRYADPALPTEREADFIFHADQCEVIAKALRLAAQPLGDVRALFRQQDFIGAGGHPLTWKIECDNLSDEDIETIAAICAPTLPKFAIAKGVPRGGVRLAAAMNVYADPDATLTLIVDDVWTTGKSMSEFAEPYDKWIGFVAFARGPLPSHVRSFMTAAIDALVPAGGVGKALNDIASERRRQIQKETWTSEHDDKHVYGELARAAICYADPLNEGRENTPVKWPWAAHWWKPKDRRRDLVRAGALIVAEIERLDRAALAPQNAGGNNTNPVLGAESASGAHVAGRTAGANPATGANSSEATPAPADDIDREAYWMGAYERMASRNHELSREIDNLRGSSGPDNAGGGQAASGGGESAEKFSELAAPIQPAPADDAAVAWRWRHPSWAPSEWHYTTNKSVDPDPALIIEPLYTRPAKAVDVDAIAHLLAKFDGNDFGQHKYGPPMSEHDRCIYRDRAGKIAALLRDSNASSDKEVK